MRPSPAPNTALSTFGLSEGLLSSRPPPSCPGAAGHWSELDSRPLNLQKEREKILEYKRQVQNLVNKSKKIVQLKPRNPEYRSSKPVILRALCDYKQDQVCPRPQLP